MPVRPSTFSIAARDPETDAEGEGEARLVDAVWHGLSRLDRV